MVTSELPGRPAVLQDQSKMSDLLNLWNIPVDVKKVYVISELPNLCRTFATGKRVSQALFAIPVNQNILIVWVSHWNNISRVDNHLASTIYNPVPTTTTKTQRISCISPAMLWFTALAFRTISKERT